MATTISRSCCFVCQKQNASYRCEGCLNTYCKSHIRDHKDELQLQLDEIENQQNIVRQIFFEQIQQSNSQQIIEQINFWEHISIEKIRQTAEQTRELILKHTNEHFQKIEIDLNRLTDRIEEIRKENDFNELEVNDLKMRLEKLQQQLNFSENIVLKQDNSSSFIKKIYIDFPDLEIRNIPVNLKWQSNAITIAGGNGTGGEISQFSCPWNILIDDEKTVYVADIRNHRIVAWRKDSTRGQIVAGGSGQGNGKNQLNSPTKVIIDKVNDYLIIADHGNKRVVRWPRENGQQGQTIISHVSCIDMVLHKNEYLYICDQEKHEVRRWKIGESEGVIVAGGNGRGMGLNQLNTPQFIYIDQDETVYVSELLNHRVMKWIKDAKEGIVVAGGHGCGTSLNQFNGAQGIFVDRLGTVYVSDWNNHRIVRWIKDAKEGTIIAGGNGQGSEPNQFHYPGGLSFDNENNLYVVDYYNHRIQKFLVDN